MLTARASASVAYSPPSILRSRYEGHLNLHGTLGKALNLKTRGSIATHQAIGYDYGLSARTCRSLNVARLDQTEITLDKEGRLGEAKANVAIACAS